MNKTIESLKSEQHRVHQNMDDTIARISEKIKNHIDSVEDKNIEFDIQLSQCASGSGSVVIITFTNKHCFWSEDVLRFEIKHMEGGGKVDLWCGYSHGSGGRTSYHGATEMDQMVAFGKIIEVCVKIDESLRVDGPSYKADILGYSELRKSAHFISNEIRNIEKDEEQVIFNNRKDKIEKAFPPISSEKVKDLIKGLVASRDTSINTVFMAIFEDKVELSEAQVLGYKDGSNKQRFVIKSHGVKEILISKSNLSVYLGRGFTFKGSRVEKANDFAHHFDLDGYFHKSPPIGMSQMMNFVDSIIESDTKVGLI
jgi:hypothetical protein